MVLTKDIIVFTYVYMLLLVSFTHILNLVFKIFVDKNLRQTSFLISAANIN